MTTHSSILAWRIPWTEEPCGLPSTCSLPPLCMVFTARTPFRVWMCVIVYLRSLSSVGAEILGQEPVCLVDPGLPVFRTPEGQSLLFPLVSPAPSIGLGRQS